MEGVCREEIIVHRHSIIIGIGFGSGGISYTGRLSFEGYTTINNEDFRIATVVNFENSNSAFVHFMDIGNGIYRVEVDVYDVFGGTDGIDPYQDYDDLVFLIGHDPI